MPISSAQNGSQIGSITTPPKETHRAITPYVLRHSLHHGIPIAGKRTLLQIVRNGLCGHAKALRHCIAANFFDEVMKCVHDPKSTVLLYIVNPQISKIEVQQN